MTDKVKIITAVVGLAIAIGIFFLTTKKEQTVTIDYYYKCTGCGRVQELSRNDVASKMAALRTTYPEITPMGLMVDCPDCGKQICRYAIKCAGCGDVFVYNPKLPQPEKCTKCGYIPTKNNE